jgi:hypothetical protein
MRTKPRPSISSRSTSASFGRQSVEREGLFADIEEIVGDGFRSLERVIELALIALGQHHRPLRCGSATLVGHERQSICVSSILRRTSA